MNSKSLRAILAEKIKEELAKRALDKNNLTSHFKEGKWTPFKEDL